jgi:hypothetical protein
MHVLTREELFAFGIDRRDGGGWVAPRRPAVGRERRQADREGKGGTFRWTMLSLACGDATTLRLEYARQVGPEAESARRCGSGH